MIRPEKMLNSNEKNLKLTASSAQTAILGAYSAMVLQALNIYMERNVFGFRTSACNLYSHAFGKLAASLFKLLCLLCKENKQMLVTLNVTYKKLK